MADAVRVIVTGSRTWTDRAVIYAELNKLLDTHGALIIVHGACPPREDGTPGADQIADDWFRAARSAGAHVFVERHPAKWKTHGRVDKTAGFKRNAEMVALGAGLALAFIRNGSPGATHCAGLAEKAGIPVRRYIDLTPAEKLTP